MKAVVASSIRAGKLEATSLAHEDWHKAAATGLWNFPPQAPHVAWHRSAAMSDARLPESHAVSVINFDRFFSIEECGQIVAWARNVPLQRAYIDPPDPRARSGRVAWIAPDDFEFEWLFRRLANLFRAVNRYYDFALDGVMESIQIAHYLDGDFIEWHTDTGGAAGTRKITVTALLTLPTFGSAELELCPTPASHNQMQGDAVIFPAFTPHRVGPQIGGERWSLTAWAHGPTFR